MSSREDLSDPDELTDADFTTLGGMPFAELDDEYKAALQHASAHQLKLLMEAAVYERRQVNTGALAFLGGLCASRAETLAYMPEEAAKFKSLASEAMDYLADEWGPGHVFDRCPY